MKTRVIEEKKIVTKDKKGTPNGFVISLWKNWEKYFKAEPKQIYMNICTPKSVKGPHLHMNRWDYFVCIQGKIRFIVKWGNEYEEVEVDADKDPCFKIVEVPPAIPCAIQNVGESDAWFINMPNPAWHPEDQDDHPISFDHYVWRNL
ncbi:MAG: WxcM-like domain-containing protein [Deltaproteobacteria bacterium]|nr:WxcM-like domain-containing protein [Deltaproteobacteria bacterium]